MADPLGWFERDGCLREVYVEVVGAPNWAVLVELAIRVSDRYVFRINGAETHGTPSFERWFGSTEEWITFRWWFELVEFGAFFEDPVRVCFDFMPTDDPAHKEAVLRFLGTVGRRFGARLRVEHECGDFEPFYIDPPTPGR